MVDGGYCSWWWWLQLVRLAVCALAHLQNENWENSAVVGDVRNLSAHLVTDESGAIKLNVTWLPPITGKKPRSYSVQVESEQLNSTTPGSSDRCAEGSTYYISEDVEKSYALLPQSKFIGETALELEIKPGCTYRVHVHANPASRRRKSTSVIISVPECVNGQCDCDRVLGTLPIPKVGLRNLQNGSYFVSWRVADPDPPSARAAKSYQISIGLPQMVSASGKQVYDRTDIATVPANDSHHYVWTGKSYEKGTKVSVTAQDEFGCSGREGVHFMETIKANSTYRKSLFILVAIAVVGLCLLATGIHGFFAHLRRQRDRRFSSPSPSSRQLHSVFRNPKIEALLKHHNALYFDLHATEGAHHHKDPGDELEIPYSRLRLLRELGRGQFGKVYLADLLGGRPVAVKMSLGGSTAQEQSGARRELLKEIEIARSAGSHPNLVGMIGYCTAAASPVCLVLEYASRGDLLTYLHKARDKATHYTRRASGGASRVFHVGDHCEPGPLSHAETTRFGLEIARGMEHLEARGIVHRDLAARNVLMDGNLVLKVSDFGLSRRGAYTLGLSPGVRRLPIRWMPPEAVGRGVFTSKSDVWSYGLVLWEIASLGDLPHPRIPDDQLLGFLVEREGRPEPLGCDPMRRTMDACWSRKPEGRPHFWQIVGWLENEGHATSKNNPAYGELA